jgi:membrane protein DedA with SNARE-associated domain
VIELTAKTNVLWALAWLMLGAVAAFSASESWQDERVQSVIMIAAVLVFVLNSLKHLRLARQPS